MSKTYATAIGNRTTSTACGTSSGVKVCAQSYDGSIIVRNWYNNDGELMIGCEISKDSRTTGDWDTPSFRGTFEDFTKMLADWQERKKISENN